MTATPTAVAAPFRVVRRVLDHVERALRPSDAALDPTAAPAPAPVTDEDSLTTRELLVPGSTDEPHAARASRQAQDYLERRRRKLSRQLEGR